MKALQFLVCGLSVVAVWLSPAHAQDATPQAPRADELYATGIKQFQAAKYAEAAETFRQAFGLQRDNKLILLNWGLSAYPAGQKGMALGAWRRALALDPSFTPARQALAFAARAMHLRDDGGSQSAWDRLRTRVLAEVSLNQLLALTACLLLSAGWLVLRYLGRRREALSSESPMPPFPLVASLLAASLVAAVVLTSLKTIELLIPRATVIAPNLQVKSGPSEGGSTLFEINEGADVIIRQSKNGWTQIHNPGGMSGWVQDRALFQTSGLLLW